MICFCCLNDLMKGYIFCKPNIIENYLMFLKMFARKMDTRALIDVSIFKPAFQIKKALEKNNQSGHQEFCQFLILVRSVDRIFQ